jgi:hypothetical protein
MPNGRVIYVIATLESRFNLIEKKPSTADYRGIQDNRGINVIATLES